MSLLAQQKATDHIYALRKEKEMLESFQRLQTNPDFKKVFMDYYSNAYLVSLALQKANPYLEEDFAKHIELKLEAIATFTRFIDDLAVSSDTIDSRLLEAELNRSNI